MKPSGCVSTDEPVVHTDAKPGCDETVLILRVASCGFWMAACLAGVLFLSVLSAWSSADRVMPLPQDTINPNTASRASLVRLSGVGPARAMAIIAYRNQNKHNDGRAFRTPTDLDAVTGLGPKTIDKMMPWISFDGVEEQTE